jgi:hypothetical protein
MMSGLNKWLRPLAEPARSAAIGVATCGILFAACDRPGGNRPAGEELDREGVAATQTEVPQFTTEQLGRKLGDYLPPLDNGRVEVAPPFKWYVRPRASNYVARFVLDRTRRALLPRISVTVERVSWEGFSRLGADNVLEFRDRVAEQFSETTRKAMLEPARAVILGDVPCVRYVVSKRFRRGDREVSAECQVIKTWHQSRIYTVSLDVFAGHLLEYHTDAYAVVAGMKFHEVAEEPPSSDKPADQLDSDLPDQMDPDEDEDEDVDPFG